MLSRKLNFAKFISFSHCLQMYNVLFQYYLISKFLVTKKDCACVHVYARAETIWRGSGSGFCQIIVVVVVIVEFAVRFSRRRELFHHRKQTAFC